MSISAFFLAVAAASQPAAPQAAPRGVEMASAQVSATIVRPAIVRQQTGPERPRDDAPRPQITRRGAEILVEFQ